MSNEDQIAELAGAVSAMQEQARKSSTAAGLPVLTMADMITTRELRRRQEAARAAAAQPRPQPLAGSVVPTAFGFTLSTPNVDLEHEIRSDVLFQVESAHYTKARAQWWAALSAGDRRAIDYAGMELIARHAAATGAVYGVAIRGYKGEIARLQAQVELLQTQGTRLEQETRDHKQRADALELAHMTAQPAPPKVEVTVQVPDEIAVRLAPNPGVVVERDAEGNVTGTRPRE